MRAAGLLDLDLPADFTVPDPSQAESDDEPFAEDAGPEFHTDFLGAEAGGEGA
jgi:segregation and condensation protein B